MASTEAGIFQSRQLPSLVGLRGGWCRWGPKHIPYRMAQNVQHHSNAYPKFFIVTSEKNELKSTSPILIHKTIISTIGEVKNTKKLKNGDLLIEVKNQSQSKNVLKLEKIGTVTVKVSAHRTLNHSRGVVSQTEFQRDLEDDILDCLKDQNVIAVRRIVLKKNNQNFPTKHLILTFNTPVLPRSVKIAFVNCPVKPYIPNPLRCFKCQKFGHTIKSCRSDQAICARCSLSDHDSNSCPSTQPKCYNCSGEHPSFFRSCPRYRLEKEIQAIKITRNISFEEARAIVNERTPQLGVSYSSVLNSTPTANKTTVQSDDTVTIKKSDWLQLLAIKQAWEEKFSLLSTSQAPSNPSPAILSQQTSSCPLVTDTELEKDPVTNSLDIPVVADATSNILKASSEIGSIAEDNDRVFQSSTASETNLTVSNSSSTLNFLAKPIILDRTNAEEVLKTTPQSSDSNPQSSDMLTDNSTELPDTAETDDFITYDPKEIMEDINHVLGAHYQPVKKEKNESFLTRYKFRKHRLKKS